MSVPIVALAVHGLTETGVIVLLLLTFVFGYLPFATSVALVVLSIKSSGLAARFGVQLVFLGLQVLAQHASYTYSSWLAVFSPALVVLVQLLVYRKTRPSEAASETPQS